MNMPNLVHADQLSGNWPKTKTDSGWVVARPLPMYSLTNRLRLALGVFAGKYDALVWPNANH